MDTRYYTSTCNEIKNKYLSHIFFEEDFNMRRKMVKSTISIALVAIVGLFLVEGCGSDNVVNGNASAGEVTVVDEKVPMDAQPQDAKEYFAKGVYASYAAELENPEKTYFYVFEGDGQGHVEDGDAGTGQYFVYEQKEDGTVEFTFGNDDPITDILTVSSYENGLVTGAFEDTIDVIFEPVEGENPDTFDAVNYVHAQRGEDFTYTSANGWSVRYNPEKFEVNTGGPVTTFVYTGECAGTNMITVTYTVDNDAEGAIKALGEAYGDDASYSEAPFLGNEDITGYWVSTPVDAEGSGSYMTAVARDYMDGALVFELTGHMSGDEMLDIEVSDYLADIIDSVQFVN